MSQPIDDCPSFVRFSTRYASANASPGFWSYEPPSSPGDAAPAAVFAQMFSYDDQRFVP